MSEKEVKEVAIAIVLTVWAILLIAIAHTILILLKAGLTINPMAAAGYLLSLTMFLVSVDTFLKRDHE